MRGVSLNELCRHRWLVEPLFAEKMMAVLERHAEGEKLTEAEREAAILEARQARGLGPKSMRRADYAVEGGVAVVPVSGPIARYAPQVGDTSVGSGTSVDEIRASLRHALNDQAVHTVLLDIDSPGGTADGIEELGTELRAMRRKKTIHAHIGELGASAAYWLAAQAHSISAGRTASVGSIGVLAVVRDFSKADAARGITTKVVRSAPLKGALTPGIEITDEALAPMQEEVDALHQVFESEIAKGRGMGAAAVRDIATGRTWIGSRAKELGLVDELSSFDATLRRLQRAGGVLPSERAAAVGDVGAPVGVTEVEGESGGSVPTEVQRSETTMTTMTTEETVPDARAISAEDFKVANAAVASALIDEGRREERERSAAIRGAAAKSQSALAEKLVAEGASIETANARLLADLRGLHEQRLEQIAANGKTAGANPDMETHDHEPKLEDLPPAEAGERIWSTRADVRETYRDQKDSFLALYRANPARAMGESK